MRANVDSYPIVSAEHDEQLGETFGRITWGNGRWCSPRVHGVGGNGETGSGFIQGRGKRGGEGRGGGTIIGA